MLDPIASAHARLDWARKHTEDFRVAAYVSYEPSANQVLAEVNPERGEMIFRLADTDPFPERLGLIAGDAIHNLRASVDGLWSAISQRYGLDEAVSFPLRKTPEGFAETKRGKSKLPPEVWAVAEDFQPYKRGEVLRLIHDLDNANKHRTILVIRCVPDSLTFDTTETVYPFVCVGPTEPGTIFAKILFSPRDSVPNIQTHTVFDVVFDEPGECFGRIVWRVLLYAHNFIRSIVVPEFGRLLQ